MSCQRACCCSRIHLRSWSMSLSTSEHGECSVSVRSSPLTGGRIGCRVGGVRGCFKADLMPRPALPGFAIGYRRISPGWATVWARWLSQPGHIHSCVLRRPPASDQAAMSPVTFPCSVSKVPSAICPSGRGGRSTPSPGLVLATCGSSASVRREVEQALPSARRPAVEVTPRRDRSPMSGRRAYPCPPVPAVLLLASPGGGSAGSSWAAWGRELDSSVACRVRALVERRGPLLASRSSSLPDVLDDRDCRPAVVTRVADATRRWR